MTSKEKAKELVLNMLHKSINKLVKGQCMEGQEEAARAVLMLAANARACRFMGIGSTTVFNKRKS